MLALGFVSVVTMLNALLLFLGEPMSMAKSCTR